MQSGAAPNRWLPLVLGLCGAVLITGFAAWFLAAEDEYVVGFLLLLAVVGAVAAARLGAIDTAASAFDHSEKTMYAVVIASVLVLAYIFREDHFTLLMITTVMVYTLAGLGLNIQFGYLGLINLSGASFIGVGAYTAAVLTMHSAVPPLLIVLIGGALSSLVGCLLILPVLRTRGHYAAVVTIAFAILFESFLKVNDILGGPQGLASGPMTLFGWSLNNPIEFGDWFYASFYMNYLLLALVLLALAFALTKRLERSWIGLSMDAVRLDETAAACYGVGIRRWKILGFTLGNFLIGAAGAVYGMMLGFIAPANFGFSDSLILVSIVLLGGIGNPWGLALASAIVVILPEKLQMIQEYRFLLFSSLVVLILLFRPDGLLPRGMRHYLPGRTGAP
ncbi:high-affinity branched-chain amino acid transport system permease BraE [Salinisphaera shabanensis T35B1]|uniref:branched-chain amino acid ABC transporter permease n=1 Tax=Salinisphaera shabanensis TaxID=180542 RepID=UPI0033407D6B